MFIDPVCGVEVDPERAAAKVAYDDEIHYFCSLACRARFLEDPGGWLRQEEEEEEEYA